MAANVILNSTAHLLNLMSFIIIYLKSINVIYRCNLSQLLTY